MGLPKDFPQPPIQPTPSEVSLESLNLDYKRLMKDHVSRTLAMRQAEKFLKLTGYIDRDRFEIHQKIRALAVALGISEDQTRVDLLLAMGNLSEFTLEGAPLIRLPLVAAEFYIDPKTQRVIIHRTGRPSQQNAYRVEDAPDFNVRFHRVKPITGAEEQWKDGDFSAIIYAEAKLYSPDHDFGSIQDSDSLRLAKTKAAALATDLRLDLYFAEDYSGFHRVGPTEIYGVIVPQMRIHETAIAIKHNKDRYHVDITDHLRGA